MFCSISGEVPQEPVVSKASGLLFEKRLIEKAIKDQGKCPVTGENLSVEDLLQVQANKALRPRPISGTSIPGLLVAFQNEWDEVMLETFTLRQHLDTTRQELAQALYQHDAACRVIARLMQERDEARMQLSSLQTQGFSAPNGSSVETAVADSAMETVEEVKEKDTEGQLAEAVVQELVATCAELSAGRKARKGGAAGGPVTATKDDLKALAVHASHTPHKADAKTGVTCVAVHAHFAVATEGPASTGKRGSAAAAAASSSSEGSFAGVALSGSTDKNVLLTHLESGKVLAKLAGHTKKINAVSFHNTVSTASTATSTALFSASADKTVRMWTAAGGDKYSEEWCYKGHDDEVLGLSMHPSGNYLVSVAGDGWHFLDARNGSFLQGAKTPATADAAQFTCGAFHPDGLILGTGTSTGHLRIWDVRTMENPHTLAGHGGAAMTCLAFSENGYQAASGAADGSVRLWDLRKLTFTQSLELGGAAIGSVAFDQSGTYLAIGGGGAEGTQLQVRVVKDWSLLADLSSAHSKAVSGVAWTAASDLVSCGQDRCIKVFQTPA